MTGYPQGIKGGEIPLSARIVAVAEAFDGLYSVEHRDSPDPIVAAMRSIAAGKGTAFDPGCVDALGGHIEMAREIMTAFADSE